MALDSMMTAVQAIIAVIECSKLQIIFSALGYKSELDELRTTVNTVQKVLLDAETMGYPDEFSNEAQLYVEQLKDVIYEADDLLDEFVTLAERDHEELLKEATTANFLDVLDAWAHRFFSFWKEPVVAFRMAIGVKEIRERLNAIADNHSKFGFKLDSKPIRNRREETCSYVYAQAIIGRDADRDKIVGKILDPNVRLRSDVSFLTIVGMGGLGKTALAQLVYNHERVTKEFPTRLWVCVGDEDTKHLYVKVVLSKILESFTKSKPDESTLEALQGNFRKQLAGKKYLLVLDDVWNENRIEWLGLEDLLKGGPSGSWVVVTTRSSITARIVGDGSSYELKGLSDEDSWNLFERVAFEHREGEANPAELVEIGQKIVKKCANVPLAIRVVGSLLYGQGEGKWLSFKQNELAEVSQNNENKLFQILKFSYHILDSQLKSCFSYCALFPKDHIIYKKMLIRLWMAQGFIVPLEKGQSIEDAGEEYFLILLRRCVFQDVEKDEYGDIISFKLHDLMHDVAKKVSEKEIRAIDCITGDLDERIRHLSVAEYTSIVGCFTHSRVRTLLYLNAGTKRLSMDTLLENWMCLRALDLSHSEIINLPSQISKLLHLRYLDLSCNNWMKVLPKSLTKLHNLETLILKGCCSLRELPNDLCKLVKLRCLDTRGCNGITQMPAGMDKLSCLQKLTMFAVDLSKPDCGDLLEGLKGLIQVKGGLEIRMKGYKNAKYEKGNSGEGGYLMNKQHLNHINFHFENLKVGKDCEEVLMEDMQPHHKLKRLRLWGYKGEKLGSWARADNLAASLPNLVEIQLGWCDGLEYLPPLGKLPHLRSLWLDGLFKLEYMEGEEKKKSRDTRGEGVEDSLFFPSLKVLKLARLHMMKGWWREEEEGVSYDDDDDDDSSSNCRRRRQPQVLPSFPQLSYLYIVRCPKLALILTVPNVETVRLKDVNEKLRVRGAVAEADREREREREREEERGGWPTCSSRSSSNIYAHPSQNSSDYAGNLSKLREVRTNKVECFTFLPSIPKLVIEYNDELRRLGQVREMWWSWSFTLRILEIRNCSNLKSVVKGGLEHLTALEELVISHCRNVTLNLNDEEGDGDGVGKHITASSSSSSTPPFVILPTLRSLMLTDLPKVVNLRDWMPHLTALEELSIGYCSNLRLTETQTKEEEGEREDSRVDAPFTSPSPPLPHTLRSLKLFDLPTVVNLPEWMQHFTSLHSLSIEDCDALKSLPEWMPHLTALEELTLGCCDNLRLTETQTKEEEGEREDSRVDDPFTSPSPPLPHTLRSLYLFSLPKLVNLPESMQHLTSLHSLKIWYCKAIESLPDWMPHLTSLNRLDIYRCSEKLKRRCSKSLSGQDWPKIHHIPHLSIQ